MTAAPVGGTNWWRRRGSGFALDLAPPPRGSDDVVLGSVDLMLGMASTSSDVELALHALEALSDASGDARWLSARRGGASPRRVDPPLADADAAVILESAERVRFIPAALPSNLPAFLFEQADRAPGYSVGETTGAGDP